MFLLGRSGLPCASSCWFWVAAAIGMFPSPILDPAPVIRTALTRAESLVPAVGEMKSYTSCLVGLIGRDSSCETWRVRYGSGGGSDSGRYGRE